MEVKFLRALPEKYNRKDLVRVGIFVFSFIALIILVTIVFDEKVETATKRPTTTEQRYIDAMELYLSDFKPGEIRYFKRMEDSIYAINEYGEIFG